MRKPSHPDTLSFPLSGLFIIDDKGILRHSTINDFPVGRSVEETLRLIKAFQFTDKHGEVCPANWQPGKATVGPVCVLPLCCPCYTLHCLPLTDGSRSKVIPSRNSSTLEKLRLADRQYHSPKPIGRFNKACLAFCLWKGLRDDLHRGDNLCGAETELQLCANFFGARPPETSQTKCEPPRPPAWCEEARVATSRQHTAKEPCTSPQSRMPECHSPSSLWILAVYWRVKHEKVFNIKFKREKTSHRA